jgi:2-polyprenyl-3-methyl-5-hydroxy-6-metoxy-1,4-benzoquinol methylase
MDGLEPLFDATRRQCLLERYAFAAQSAKEKRVLDLGSGTGYGSALLKSQGNADSVLGVDNDLFAVNHANAQYASPDVAFMLANVELEDLPNESFDLITAFEILEYVKADGSFLKRCHDWLKPEGMLFITSPDTWHNAMTWRHRRSHSRVTFENFIKRVFPRVEFFIHEPAYECSHPVAFEAKTIRPCIPEDYLEPGQVILAQCFK